MGARVNGKIVPLRYKLKNGDIVEILTSAGHNPSRDWLALAVTNKARAKIRHYLNTAEKQQALEIGKKHFERELQALRPHPARSSWPSGAGRRPSPRSWAWAPRLDDLFAAVGYGKVSMRQVLARLVPAEKLERRRRPREAAPLTDAVKRLLRVGEERRQGQGHRRPPDLPRQVLQPDHGRAHRRATSPAARASPSTPRAAPTS